MIELVKRYEIKFLVLCMVLLAMAAGWVLLTRPAHRIEGDFLQREDRRVVDEWLREQLDSRVAETRARACLALGRVGDESTLDLLLKALDDPIPRVRAEAAFAIGEMDDRDTRAELGREPREAAAAGLMVALGDDERIVVTDAVDALGKLEWQPSFPRITQTAAPLPVTITALVRLGNPEAIAWIAARRRSDDQETRWAATRALLELRAGIGEDFTRSFVNLTRDLNSWIRIAAARGLGRAKPAEEVASALAKLTVDPDPKVRMRALRSIGEAQSAGAFSILVKALGDCNQNVRAAAVEALGNLGDTKAVPLIESLRFQASPVSYQAEIALAGLGARSIFSDPGAGVPKEYQSPSAIEAFLLGIRAGAPPLLLSWVAGLAQADPEYARSSRPSILRVLSEAGHPSAEPLLQKAIGDPDPRLRRVGLELSRSISIQICRAAYHHAVKERTPGVRLAALDGAARTGATPQVKALLLTALDDPSRPVRLRAVKHLRLLFDEHHDEKIGPADVRYEEQDYQRIARTTSRLVRIETSIGEIELKLDYDNAALTARNFVELARAGFFDGQLLAEVVPGSHVLVVNDGRTDSGALLPTMRTEISRQPFLRGSLAMAEDGKDSATGRFFICLAPKPLWEGRYTNFGRLVSGDALLDRITAKTRILKVAVP